MKLVRTERIRFVRALQSQRFALLWTGQTISHLGDGAYLTALAWQVLRLTGSGTAMGLVLVAVSIPQVVFLLVGGVVADRLPRRLVLLVSDVGRASVVLLIALLGWLHLLQLWHLITMSLLFGVASGFFFPAYQAIPPQLVEADDLPSANALMALSRQLGQLVGPILGAACVALAGPPIAFAFDGVTFVLSALCILAMQPAVRVDASASLSTAPFPDKNVTDEQTAVSPTRSRSGSEIRRAWRDIQEGLGYVTRYPWLWVTITVFALGNVGLAGPLLVALPKLVYVVYGAGVWLLGMLGTADALGSIVGSLLIGQMKNLHRRGLLAYLGVALSSIGIILLGIPLPHAIEPAIAIFASILFGLGEGAFSVIWITVLQELVPSDKLGRVFSIDALGSFCLLPIGYALVGILTDRIGPAQVFIFGGLMNLIFVGIALSVRDVRQLD